LPEYGNGDARGIARGGQWTAVQVAAILHRVGRASQTNNKQNDPWSNFHPADIGVR
jgi:hypothetical protein